MAQTKIYFESTLMFITITEFRWVVPIDINSLEINHKQHLTPSQEPYGKTVPTTIVICQAFGLYGQVKVFIQPIKPS